MFGWGSKSGMMEKMSLNKFTHIRLLKNDTQLKQKSDVWPQKGAMILPRGEDKKIKAMILPREEEKKI